MNFFNHPIHKIFNPPLILLLNSIFNYNSHLLNYLNSYYSPLTTILTNLNFLLNFPPHSNEHTIYIYQLYFYTIHTTNTHPSSIN